MDEQAVRGDAGKMSGGRKEKKGRSKKRVIPGFGVTLGVTVTMLSVLILIPLASILVCSFKLSPAEFLDVILAENVMKAFGTSISCAFIAAVINCVSGLLLAWVLVRYDFPGRRLMDAMIELPFALPTAVAGITLAKMCADNGMVGSIFARFGIAISYTKTGIVVAMVFIGIPFVVRSVQPVLEKLPSEIEEAGVMLGASKRRIFLRIILPELMPALLTGFALALARGIGEYGSVIYISGNSAKNGTQVVSYIIMQKLNAGSVDYEGAAAIALVMLVISFALLFIINMIQLAAAARTSGESQVSKESANRQQRVQRGEVVLLAAAVAFFIIMLILPLFCVIYRSLKDGLEFYVSAVTAEYTLSALRVTLIAAAIAVIVNTFFGLCASWLLSKFHFRGSRILATLIDIPYSISPVIAGLAFIMTFGRMGWASPILDAVNDFLGTDIALVFSVPGVVLATIFVTFPYISRELLPVMQSQGTDEEEAAALMGAKGLTIFRRVTLPNIKWALVYGIILCAARAVGEFGAVYAVSKTRGETFTLPLEIDALYMAGSADSITQAFAVSSLLVMVAILMLVLRQVAEYMGNRQTKKNK